VLVVVDGFVAGMWTLERRRADAVVHIHPFAKLAPRDRTAALVEGEQLARFMAPEAKIHGATVG
jgi:hypothetical protein